LGDSESRLFGRYLLDIEPSLELQQRYAAACRKLFADPAPPELRFVRRHPWALPLVDAAAGLRHPQSELRQRLLLMAAILETTPDYAEFFLTTPSPATVVWQGIRSAVKIALGIPILAVARRA